MAALDIVKRISLIVNRKKQSYPTVSGVRQTIHPHGFSLIELLVAVGIIALVGAVSVPNLNRLSRQQEVDSVASNLSNTLRKAQSSAVSRIRCPNGEGSLGWIVRLAPSSYSLIADCQTSGPQTLYTRFYAPSETATVATYSGNSNVCPGFTVDVMFSRSQVSYLCSDSTIPQAGTVILTLTGIGTTLTKTVKIEQGGIIKIE